MRSGRRLVGMAAGLAVLVALGVAAAQVRRNPPPPNRPPPLPPAVVVVAPAVVGGVQRVELACTSDVAETRFCDAAGACMTSRAPCFPYACDAAAHTCGASCGIGVACAAGAECDDGKCVPSRQVPHCEGNLQVAPGGARRDCRLARCDTATGQCVPRCATDADCVPGAACVVDTCVQRLGEAP